MDGDPAPHIFGEIPAAVLESSTCAKGHHRDELQSGVSNPNSGAHGDVTVNGVCRDLQQGWEHVGVTTRKRESHRFTVDPDTRLPNRALFSPGGDRTDLNVVTSVRLSQQDHSDIIPLVIQGHVSPRFPLYSLMIRTCAVRREMR